MESREHHDLENLRTDFDDSPLRGLGDWLRHGPLERPVLGIINPWPPTTTRVRVHQVDSAFDQVGRDMLGRVPRPFQAICSFLTSGERHNAVCAAYAPSRRHEIRRSFHRHGAHQGCVDKTGCYCRQEAASPSSALDRSLPLRVAACGIHGRILPRLRDGMHRNRATYCPDLAGSGTTPHKYGSDGALLNPCGPGSFGNVPCIAENNIFDHGANLLAPLHTQRISATCA